MDKLMLEATRVILIDKLDGSRAGQYETFLNIKGEDQLEEAVLACFRSAEAARVAAYRDSLGAEPSPAAAAGAGAAAISGRCFPVLRLPLPCRYSRSPSIGDSRKCTAGKGSSGD
jgi:hypothetical protein